MKLNPDCMRDILFYLEEYLSISEELEFEEISMYDLAQHLDYPIQEIANTLVILDETGYIISVRNDNDDRIADLDVYRITYDSYQFIETIRPEPVWEKVKSTGKHIGSFSIDVITRVATTVLTSMINGYLTGALNL